MTNGLFESFNARPVEPELVGKSFVYNSIFRKLTHNNNSIVIGPRGSGKTTYFKMLTLPALLSWKNPQRNKIISTIDYTAVYVPTDFSWFPDFRHPVGLELDPQLDNILSYARFRNGVLRRIISALDSASNTHLPAKSVMRKFQVDISASAMKELAESIARGWGIEPHFDGLGGIIEALNQRNRVIQRLLASAYYDPEKVSAKIADQSFLQDRIFDDLTSFADAFERTTNTSRQWAMCFDEVEIAPNSIKREIWASLRSFDQRFLVKLSASPYDDSLWSDSQPHQAMKGNDYEEIWTTLERKDVEDFSLKILAGICSDLKIPPQRRSALLGSSYYDDDFSISLSRINAGQTKNDRPASALTKNKTGFYYEKFSALERKDASFAKFLQRTKIDPDNFTDLTGNRRAFIRKFISSVVIRDAYLRERGKSRLPQLKSKKAIDRFFTGQKTIFTICEGNPRWLLVVLRPMLEAYVHSNVRRTETIPRELQAKSLEDGVSTLLSILSTISPDAKSGSKGPTLLEIIERTGDFFFEEVLGDTFVPEPILSFEVDADIDDRTLSYIGAALNQGAFMVVPNSRNPRTTEINNKRSLVGQRLRLSYYLAPRYRLPLVLGRSKKLSTILANKKNSSATEEQIMLDLFGDFE